MSQTLHRQKQYSLLHYKNRIIWKEYKYSHHTVMKHESCDKLLDWVRFDFLDFLMCFVNTLYQLVNLKLNFIIIPAFDLHNVNIFPAHSKGYLYLVMTWWWLHWKLNQELVHSTKAHDSSLKNQYWCNQHVLSGKSISCVQQGPLSSETIKLVTEVCSTRGFKMKGWTIRTQSVL